MAKGSNFERETCKQLSLWWTDGKRDDIFWRATTSGARATTRAKTGRKTAGSYGDVAAIHPDGLKLLKLVAIELKRGYPLASFANVLDTSSRSKQLPFEDFVQQAVTAAENAKCPFWWLITKRDQCERMIFMPMALAYKLDLQLVTPRVSFRAPIRFRFEVSRKKIPGQKRKRREYETTTRSRTIFGMRLNDFLARVKRRHILEFMATWRAWL